MRRISTVAMLFIVVVLAVAVEHAWRHEAMVAVGDCLLLMAGVIVWWWRR